jgi:hypothetical protein
MNMEVEIDECLEPLIKVLQEYGIKTRSCCCGHGEEADGKEINNRLILSTEGSRMGTRGEDGKVSGWEDPLDFNIWSISIPIKMPSK